VEGPRVLENKFRSRITSFHVISLNDICIQSIKMLFLCDSFYGDFDDFLIAILLFTGSAEFDRGRCPRPRA
jgi:hypothetical protein